MGKQLVKGLAIVTIAFVLMACGKDQVNTRNIKSDAISYHSSKGHADVSVTLDNSVSSAAFQEN